MISTNVRSSLSVVSKFLFSGALLVLSSLEAQAQTVKTDSLLMRDFSYVMQSDPWLMGNNPSALIRFGSSTLSEATVSMTVGNGGFVNYDQSPHTLTFGASAESVYRLSPRTVVYGRMSYQNESSSNMAGSAFLNTYHLPFDIVEDSLTNEGDEHRDTYHLKGGVGVDIWHGWSVGASFDFTAANLAKYKDLRHQNKAMDLTFSAGFYLPLGHVSLGANYLYRRSTENIRFKVYGQSDKVYKSLIAYANFMGQVEQFTTNGYTGSNNEQPLFSARHGACVQLDWRITPQWQWYHSMMAQYRSGYYGRESAYTITYMRHHSHIYTYQSRLSYRLPTSLHRMDVSISAERLENNQNAYLETLNEQGASQYEYFGAVKTGDKLWVDTHIGYTGDMGIDYELPRWTVATGVNIGHRKQTGYRYPYYRRQRLNQVQGYIDACHRIRLRQGILQAGLLFAYQKGSDDVYEDLTFAEPSAQQTAPPSMDAYLYRDYEYYTAPQVKVGAALKYSFVFPQTRMKTYVEGKCTYLKAYNTDAYLKGDAYTTVMLIVGVDF
ncbi:MULTISPECIES: DUF6850 family outer membrane beta-barrel protein [Segatella]|uniref:DUF6850 family outer membrane beta-barrel protein n=1 Tax=Segatella TaxID=2974251 RepID=UPI0008C88020|nr:MULTISPECIES: DUF6850 family outer membrane beta-barrel protein [Segatella]UKK79640.1 hypothetical protein L6469_10760 [Segatella baroniae B14]SEQ65758.1 hypothetical protein SAMN05444375_11216 [Segatella baroniae B14]